MIDKFDANNYQSILTEIIMFNETMVSRWNDKINNTQLKIFFQMCIKLQNLIKTKKL
jgi:hypothetical protein